MLSVTCHCVVKCNMSLYCLPLTDEYHAMGISISSVLCFEKVLGREANVGVLNNLNGSGWR